MAKAKKPTYDELAALLRSTRDIVAIHMTYRGFNKRQINESMPETDAALKALGLNA